MTIGTLEGSLRKKSRTSSANPCHDSQEEDTVTGTFQTWIAGLPDEHGALARPCARHTRKRPVKGPQASGSGDHRLV
jgi:hypothetical protein